MKLDWTEAEFHAHQARVKGHPPDRRVVVAVPLPVVRPHMHDPLVLDDRLHVGAIGLRAAIALIPPCQRGELTLAACDGSKTELRYASQLEALQSSGAIARYWHHQISLRWGITEAGKGRYSTLDYCVELPDGRLELHEVKGHLFPRDAATYAALRNLYPWLPLRMVRWVKGEWIIT